jgi:hypothetical protein
MCKSVKKKQKKATNLIKQKQKTLPIGLWPWRGWWVLSQQETESSLLQVFAL